MKFLILIMIVVGIGTSMYVADEHWPSTAADIQIKADSLLVQKRLRSLTLYANGIPIKSYRIALGGDPVGHKQFEGDQRTPEGLYRIEWRKENSSYYRALRVSYPNPNDRTAAERMNKNPGGDIMVHGAPRGLGLFGSIMNEFDWTNGCIAVDNASMAEIWSSVDVGTPILITP
jgi:murein L,D-transpeptidase YafK